MLRKELIYRELFFCYAEPTKIGFSFTNELFYLKNPLNGVNLLHERDRKYRIKKGVLQVTVATTELLYDLNLGA